MHKNYDECLGHLNDLVQEFRTATHASINEDTTRIRFIDTLFFECLDWNRFTQVETEEYIDTGIIDYSMCLDAGTMLILEAKRVGIHFTLPSEQGKPGRLVRTIDGIQSLDKGIASAITQAATYVVCNGWQVIAFGTQQQPGVSWRKGKALVFDSLEAIQSNFRVFWDNLSIDGIRRFELRRMLSNAIPSAPCPKRSATIPNYNRYKNRNSFQADLQILGDLVFWGRIFEDRTLFHEHCYCAGGSIPQFSRASRSYLEDRYPEFFESTAGTPTLEPAQTKKGLRPH